MAGKSTYLRQVALIVLHGPDRQLRPGGVGHHRPGGPHLHPHRRPGGPGRRAVHLHGGDGGDGQHPEQRHAPVAAHPGRDRAGHQHLRRAVHRPGGGRVHPQPPRAGRQDPLRHPLPRAGGAGRLPAPGEELQRGRDRGAGRGRLPAQGHPRRGRQELRHPRGPAGRAAAVGDPPGPGGARRPGGQSSAQSPAEPGKARRAPASPPSRYSSSARSRRCSTNC